ncbi:MAG: GNAT family N-acetyltransferase [Telluria sp.]
MQLRRAAAADADAVSALLLGLAHFCTLDPDGKGAEPFLASFAPEALGKLFADPAYRYYLAEIDGQLAAVVALRDNKHLFHLFVREAFQGRGLARQLWEQVRDEALALGNPGEFTVNSSDFAERMYLKLGFVPTAPRQEMHGIAFIPMRLGAAPEAAEIG